MIAGGASGGTGSLIGLGMYPGLTSGGRGSFGITSGPDGGSGMNGLGAGIVICSSSVYGSTGHFEWWLFVCRHRAM